jgi:hypothetical protein
MAKHEPIVLERIDWRITKVACSCGAPLQLSGDVGSPKEQSEKLVAAIKMHKTERQAARPKTVQAAMPKATIKKPREDVNQAAARTVREATKD